ncbi:hypothetical protein NKH77_53600 [Streptomyces sp. M19]
MVKEITEALVTLPDPLAWTPTQARQVLVHLSMSGASIVRHYQEKGLARTTTSPFRCP